VGSICNVDLSPRAAVPNMVSPEAHIFGIAIEIWPTSSTLSGCNAQTDYFSIHKDCCFQDRRTRRNKTHHTQLSLARFNPKWYMDSEHTSALEIRPHKPSQRPAWRLHNLALSFSQTNTSIIHHWGCMAAIGRVMPLRPDFSWTFSLGLCTRTQSNGSIIENLNLAPRTRASICSFPKDALVADCRPCAHMVRVNIIREIKLSGIGLLKIERK
jgi:hypothetical protein